MHVSPFSAQVYKNIYNFIEEVFELYWNSKNIIKDELVTLSIKTPMFYL